jgi:hypothetical protein
MRFTDTRGREWSIEFTCASVRVLERELGMRALDFNGCFWPAINDDSKTMDMVWELVREQATRQGVPMMSFLEAMDQAKLEEARNALFTEYIRFFRSPSRRDLLEQLKNGMQEIRRVVEERTRAALAAIRTELDGNRSSSAAASSASSPGPTPSAT